MTTLMKVVSINYKVRHTCRLTANIFHKFLFTRRNIINWILRLKIFKGPLRIVKLSMRILTKGRWIWSTS